MVSLGDKYEFDTPYCVGVAKISVSIQLDFNHRDPVSLALFIFFCEAGRAT